MISCNMIPCTCGNCLACDICGKRAGQAHGPQHRQAHEARERGKREGIAEGRKLERADIVGWLASDSDQGPGGYFAAAIEHGEHAAGGGRRNGSPNR